MERRHVVERFVAVVMLALTSPLSVVIAVAIKASSRGPVLFRSERSGLDARTFTMFKFRTMHVAPQAGPFAARITSPRDQRVFPVGRMLRRFKLDEIPQLLNVASGDMAVVGPRPEDASIVAEVYTTFMRESLTVRPGLTSPGTLHYFAHEHALPDDSMDAERLYLSDILVRKIALDLVYVRHRSWLYDLELVVRAVAGIVGIRSIFQAKQSWELQEAEAIMPPEASRQTR